ncbi:MAG TPA: outer membrane protein assembly factor BamE [Burkholderiaceae bacterium]|jgi:hypothetical protein|nr:outer membrane protein assembly factor BamE [Burkholderiaceae bacterium]
MSAAAALALAASGCDYFAQTRLQPGHHTEADVRKLMGRPEMVWEDDRGVRVLEYPRAPEGTETYMVQIGADGRLQSITQVLTEENFAKVRPGMSRDDVRRLLGKPSEIVRFELKREEVWAWKYVGQLGQPHFFDVHFDVGDSRVKSVNRTIDPKVFATS